MKLEDLLIQNGPSCSLNVGVQHDPSVFTDFLVIGAATMARSQYLVYNYEYGKERLGFGGPFTRYTVPKPPNPEDNSNGTPKTIPGWAIALLVFIGVAAIGAILFLYTQYRKKTIKGQLEVYEN